MTEQTYDLPQYSYLVGYADSEQDPTASNGINFRRGGPRKLTDTGHEDARSAGAALAGLGIDPDVTMVVYQGPAYSAGFDLSGIPRSRTVYHQTAQAIAHGMGMQREAVMMFRGGVRSPNIHSSIELNSHLFRNSTAMLQISVIADVVGRLIEESKTFESAGELGGLVLVLDHDTVQSILPEANIERNGCQVYDLNGIPIDER